jgi:ribosomal protein L9
LFQQEQDKLSNRDRSNREAEQERQWKQLQAMRQQQAQIQQQVIHDQRAHGKLYTKCTAKCITNSTKASN